MTQSRYLRDHQAFNINAADLDATIVNEQQAAHRALNGETMQEGISDSAILSVVREAPADPDPKNLDGTVKTGVDLLAAGLDGQIRKHNQARANAPRA